MSGDRSRQSDIETYIDQLSIAQLLSEAQRRLDDSEELRSHVQLRSCLVETIRELSEDEMDEELRNESVGVLQDLLKCVLELDVETPMNIANSGDECFQDRCSDEDLDMATLGEENMRDASIVDNEEEDVKSWAGTDHAAWREGGGCSDGREAQLHAALHAACATLIQLIGPINVLSPESSDCESG